MLFKTLRCYLSRIAWIPSLKKKLKTVPSLHSSTLVDSMSSFWMAQGQPQTTMYPEPWQSRNEKKKKQLNNIWQINFVAQKQNQCVLKDHFDGRILSFKDEFLKIQSRIHTCFIHVLFCTKTKRIVFSPIFKSISFLRRLRSAPNLDF